MSSETLSTIFIPDATSAHVTVRRIPPISLVAVLFDAFGGRDVPSAIFKLIGFFRSISTSSWRVVVMGSWDHDATVLPVDYADVCP